MPGSQRESLFDIQVTAEAFNAGKATLVQYRKMPLGTRVAYTKISHSLSTDRSSFHVPSM